MRKFLLFVIFCVFSTTAWVQSVTITGDQLLCPGGEGTAQVTGSVDYDTYQWFFRYDFEGPFQAIPGANEPSFTYGAYDFVGSEIRLQVTLDGTIHESNILMIDGLVFLPIFVMSDFNEFVTIGDMGEMLLCNGGVVTMALGMPYSASIQWFKDGVALPGENYVEYQATQPGEYWVQAAPGDCPEYVVTSLPMTVGVQQGCDLSVPEVSAGHFAMYPNPAAHEVTIASGVEITGVRVYDATGKSVYEQTPNAHQVQMGLHGWAAGIYFVHVEHGSGSSVLKLIVQ